MNCENCGTQMKIREKNGDKFWGCPNYKTCGAKTKPFQPQGTPPKPFKTQNLASGDFNFENFVAEELANINLRLDKLVEFLKEKFK